MAKEKEKERNTVNVVIETPRGCRNKYDYNKKLKAFKLKKILPAGAVFPFDFGFIPDTEGEDGDPLDILVIMDEAAYPGCIVECRIIGALKARQSQKGTMIENDRLVGVSVVSNDNKHIWEITDLNNNLKDEIQHFFVSYNSEEGKKFEPQGWAGSAEARMLIEEAS